MAGVSWTSWIQEWVPERIRGKYFGSRNRVLGLVTVAFILATGEVFSRYGESMLAFQIILGVTSGLRLLSVYLMTHIYTPWSQPEKMIHEGSLGRFQLLLQNKPFKTYLVFAAVLAFCFSLTGPFAPLFMTRHLSFPVSQQTTLLVIASLFSAFTMPIWGKLCDRYGCRPVIIGTGTLWMIQNYLWVILTPSLTWLLYPMWAWGGALSGGVILGGFNLVLKLTPNQMKSTGISLHLAATSIAAAIAPVLAGWLISTQSLPLSEGAIRFRILFAIQPTVVIASFLILAKLDEPKATELSLLSGAFRTMRQVLVQNGFLFVGNLNFFRLLKKRTGSAVPTKKPASHETKPVE
jgi:MFS family permease